MIENIDPNEITNWDIKQLWKTLQVLIELGEINCDKSDLIKIKNGINMNIPIVYLYEGWYEVYPSSHQVLIKGFSKHPLLIFYDELEERETLIRKIINDNIEDDGILKGRDE